MILSSVGSRLDAPLNFSSFNGGFPGNNYDDLVSPRFLTYGVSVSDGPYTLLHGCLDGADSRSFGSSPVTVPYSIGLQ
ncbi:MAG: hypothetical protein OEZ32_06070 [Nitrospinota bacterium]|nr:hypothetical protein [Nitrospinota bacterium]